MLLIGLLCISMYISSFLSWRRQLTDSKLPLSLAIMNNKIGLFGCHMHVFADLLPIHN